MRTPIYLRRGNKADLPALAAGEPGVALDAKQMFFGAAGGNVGLASVLSGGHKLQTGVTSLTAAANTYTTQTVTFPIPFAGAPQAFAQLAQSDSYLGVGTGGELTTSFDITVNNTSSSPMAVTVKWHAIGT